MTLDRDRYPRWLYERYGHSSKPWEQLDKGDRIRWQEEADAVIRAAVRLAIYEIKTRP